MLAGDKNLKDSTKDTNISLTDISFSISYTKTHKLITALYMVTDIMDRGEPLRNKLRTLGVEILSDTISMSRLNLDKKIQEVLSFIDVALTLNFISEMNCAILKKEFLELKTSIGHLDVKPMWLEELFSVPQPKGHYIGQSLRTRIGVQKGSTLMKALSDLEAKPNILGLASHFGFNILKKQRQNDIIDIVKSNGGNATITDIRTKINTEIHKSLASCSEKTLQRELMSMTKDGVLNKTGEKRWSRYFIKVLGS